MGKEIYLHIQEPCHENWEAMSPDQQGRFCQSCAKRVIDFSQMSDHQILDILSKASGNTCGRFTSGQLERPMGEEKKTIPFFLKPYKIALASMVPLFILSSEAPAQDIQLKGKVSTRQEIPALPVLLGDVNIVNSNISVLGGRVLSEEGKVLKKAAVSIKGTKTRTVSDDTGSFLFEFRKQHQKITLVVSAEGYETKEIVVGRDQTNPLDIKLKRQEEVVVMGYAIPKKVSVSRKTPSIKENLSTLQVIQPKEIIVKGRIVNNHHEPLPQATVSINGFRKNVSIDSSGYFSLPIEADQTEAIISATHAGYQQAFTNILLHKDGLGDVKLVLEQQPSLDTAIIVSYSNLCLTGRVGGLSIVETVTPRDTLKTWVQKIFRNELFTAFPNPVAKGQSLHLRFKREGDYSLQLFDNSGRLYVEKQIKTAGQAQDFLLAMPATVGSGAYYLKAVNIISKKQYIEKIIVP